MAKTIDIESYLERRRAGHERDEPSAECELLLKIRGIRVLLLLCVVGL